jgi:hypothetical protein
MARPLPARRPAAVLAVLLVAGALVTGCGGDDDADRTASATTGPATTRTSPGTTESTPATPGTTESTPALPRTSEEAERAERRAFPDLAPLREVPQTATGPADADDRKIAERWFALVRDGKDAEAGALLADGVRFANIDVLKLQNRAAREAIGESLPCGAEPVQVGGAKDGYVVLILKLVDKEGEPPCQGAGSPVAVSLHVTDGRIDDWVRVQADDAPINRGAPV